MFNLVDLPIPLQELPQPPKQLFTSGLPIKDWIYKPKLAVVGSRKLSNYGAHVTGKFAADAARAGIVIISGLAIGVDSIAQAAAVRVGGTTVSVLPGPLDKIYPASHEQLANKILGSGGSLISEYESGSQIYKHNFIARNRIIAALSDAVLITEATINSGSLHTARFALELGKSVLAVPGDITNANSEGTNNLIKSGATPVTCSEDIFFALGLSMEAGHAQKQYKLGSRAERAVVELLNIGIRQQTELAIKSKLSASEFNMTLTMLEINGVVRPLGAGEWTLA